MITALDIVVSSQPQDLPEAIDDAIPAAIEAEGIGGGYGGYGGYGDYYGDGGYGDGDGGDGDGGYGDNGG